MRCIIVAVCAFILGALIGGYLAHQHGEAQIAELISESLGELESFEGARAAHAIGVMRLVESGDDDAALRSLSTPIAHYYVLYKDSVETRHRRSNLFATIENLTNNRIVAEAVNEKLNRTSVEKKGLHNLE